MADDEERELGPDQGLVWLDSVRYGLVATWEVGYVDRDTNEIVHVEVTARSVWLGPGGTLVFKIGDYERFAAAYGPTGWDTIVRVAGSTKHQERKP